MNAIADIRSILFRAVGVLIGTIMPAEPSLITTDGSLNLSRPRA
jgi:hypothetical protein